MPGLHTSTGVWGEVTIQRETPDKRIAPHGVITLLVDGNLRTTLLREDKDQGEHVGFMLDADEGPEYYISVYKYTTALSEWEDGETGLNFPM